MKTTKYYLVNINGVIQPKSEVFLNADDIEIENYKLATILDMNLDAGTGADIDEGIIEIEEGLAKWNDEEGYILIRAKDDDRILLFYDGEVVGRILTNQSLSIEQACELCGIDINSEDYNYELFELEY